ncbi:actin-like ATPase domain-containing protein [Ramicandelaber brevisporus]|nr:actin-like ATPase domain-containing protein [Ramicandelaber brevisporus]
MDAGLADPETRQAKFTSKGIPALAMLPSYIPGKPTGSESGVYAALDLGGTNFRVSVVELFNALQQEHLNPNDGQQAEKVTVTQTKMPIPLELKSAHIDELHEYMCGRMLKYLKDIMASSNRKTTEAAGAATAVNFNCPVGYTFSYPVDQRGAASGVLTQWTKEFSCPGAVGNDIVALINKSLAETAAKQSLRASSDDNGVAMHAHVAAILNDTVAALLAAAYLDPRTCIGVIAGTGSNACYLEKISRIIKLDPTWKENYSTQSGKANLDDEVMAINIEWGAADAGRQVLPFTEYDVQLDKESSIPGAQLFEKTISGKYLGEIVRLVLADLIQKKVLFASASALVRPPPPYNLETEDLGTILNNANTDVDGPIGTLIATKFKSADTGFTPSPEDIATIRQVCSAVVRRAGKFMGAGLVTLLKRSVSPADLDINTSPGVVIAVDGALWKFMSEFRDAVKEGMQIVFGDENNMKGVSFFPVKSGSSIGAAIAAMMVTRGH